MRHGFFRYYPLLWVLIPVIGGIAWGYLFAIPLFVYLLLALLSLVGMWGAHRRLTRHFRELRSEWLFATSVWLLFGSLAAYRVGEVLHDTRPLLLPRGDYRVELSQALKPKEGWSVAEGRIVWAKDSTNWIRNAHVLLIVQGKKGDNLPLLAGQCLDIHTQFDPLLPEADPFAPDLSLYYRTRGITARGFVDTLHWRQSDQTDEGGMLKEFRNLQFRLAQLIDRSIENRPTAALMQAMLLGYKSDLSPQTKAEFRASGLSHVLAVSGLHVGIVAWLIGMLLFFVPPTRGFRWVRWGVSVLLIVCYGALSGFSISAVRASMLFVVLQTGFMLRRQRNALHTLFLVASLQLGYNPLYLFDIGFQLSYVAVGAILWLAPLLEARLFRYPVITQRLVSSIVITIWVQLALLPLLLFHFHQFPIAFLPANLVVLPLLSWVMGGGFVWLCGAYWGVKWPEFSRLVAQSFEWIGDIARRVGTYQPLSWDRLWVSPLTAVLLYAVGAMLIVYIRQGGRWAKRAMFFSIGLTVISILYTHFQRSSYQSIALYSIGKGTVLHIVTHNAAHWIRLEGEVDEIGLRRRLDGVLSYKSIDSTWRVVSPAQLPQIGYRLPLLKVQNRSVFIADSVVSHTHHPLLPLEVDYLVLTSAYKGPISELQLWCIPQQILCSDRLPTWTIHELLSDPLWGEKSIRFLPRRGSVVERLK